jgi:hypothetical protein
MQRTRLTPTRRTMSVLVAALALLAAAAVAHAAIATVTLRGPDRISSEFSRDSVIASGDANRFVAAWTQRGPKTGIYVSDLRFGSWVRPVLVPGSQDGEEPQVAMAPNGATVVAWAVQHGDPRSGQVGVSYRAPGGAFSPAKYLGDRTDSAQNNDIEVAINSAGRSVVAWTHVGDARSVQAVLGSGPNLGDIQTLDTGASDPAVAIDAAGRAIAIYAQDPNLVRQALAPEGGGFGAATTLDVGPDENSVSTNLRVVSNTSGAIATGWGDICDDDCDNLFYVKMAIGTTSAGVTSFAPVSNAGSGPSSAGPDRKHGSTTEVAIDEGGNATMVWEGSTAGMEGYDLWAAHYTPTGGFSPTSSFGTSTEAVDNELQVAMADGHVLVAWVDAPSANQPSRLWTNQVDMPAPGAASTWPTAAAASTLGVSADTLGVALSPGGLAALVFRVEDRTWANTNAPRDTTKPTVTVPANGRALRLRANGVAAWRAGCPATEADCTGTAKATMRVLVNGRPRTVVASAPTFAPWYALGGRSGFAELHLTRAAKAALRSRGRLQVTITTTVKDAAGNAGLKVARTSVLLPAIRR